MTNRPNVPGTIVLACWIVNLGLACSAAAQSEPVYRGKPLKFWVGQASAQGGPEDLDATVGAERGVGQRRPERKTSMPATHWPCWVRRRCPHCRH